MATQTIEFTTSTKLACSSCLPADVVLCIPVSLDAHAVEDSIIGILEGSLTVVNTSGQYYVYTISYDDTQIVEGESLTAEMIQGIFCEGCMTNWVRELIIRTIADTFCFEDLFLCT